MILQQGGDPARALYVVRKGAVELLDDGSLLDQLVEGEVFGQFSLLADESPTLTVRAQEDTLCYLVLPRPPTPCSGRGRASRSYREHAPPDHLGGGVLGRRRRPPAHPRRIAPCAANRSPRTPRRPSPRPPQGWPTNGCPRCRSRRPTGWGIVTDRDLRTRWWRWAPTRHPVVEIATFPVGTIDRETPPATPCSGCSPTGCTTIPVIERPADASWAWSPTPT